MIINEEVKKISRLAKLKFSDSQISNLATQLTNIMDMIDELDNVNCDNVEPLTSVCDTKLVMRKDEITVEDISDELFSNVSGKFAELAKEIKCFIVPKVVE